MALASVSTNPEADQMSGPHAGLQPESVHAHRPGQRRPGDPDGARRQPYKTLKDLVEDAKKRPEAINYSSSGNYGTYHVATEMFASAAGIRMKHIPYGGGGPALTALLGGQVDTGLLGPSVAIAQIRSGKLRALASWGGKRIASLPEVPTLKELGYPVEYTIWSGLFAPAGTPEPVIRTLREAMRRWWSITNSRARWTSSKPHRLHGRAGIQAILGRGRQTADRGGAQDRHLGHPSNVATVNNVSNA